MTTRSDRWLAVGFMLLATIEVLVRPELLQRPLAVVLTYAFALALAFRRHQAFAATAFAFSLATLMTVRDLWLGLPPISMSTSACVLLLPYSLCRWATRRQVVVGAGLLAATWVATVAHGETHGVSELIGSAVVLLFPGALGAMVRFRDDAQQRDVERARLRERQQLARELHDSVAHHVTAITLQAQAASAVLATRPDDARVALAAIEDESRRTLAELRAIVGALRDEEDAALAPAGKISDLAALSRPSARPTINVELVGDLEHLSPALERAVFRLAQESVTNALKHARNATRVELRVAGDAGDVRLTARDDGELQSAQRGGGFGLLGMAERAALLQGTFEAGPQPGGGWRVEAVLPRKGTER